MQKSNLLRTVENFQALAIRICAVVLFSFSSALASEARVGPDAVPQSVNSLDLCTLAYQLYHQSLCLPLDPWYDVMSRVGSDRRDNICRLTHEYAATLGKPDARAAEDQGFYSGPNAARDWSGTNLKLDPILTNYRHLDVKLPAFTRDGERFLAVLAPSYVTENIKKMEVVRYKNKPTSFPCNDVERIQVRDYLSGEDHLIAFEGGTGIVAGSNPSWSLMGFVLMQKTPTGYDAHIVFRGSRSGASLATTVWKAQNAIGEAKGNPDWITDLRGVKQIESPLISKIGKVTEGFAQSLPTMLGPITACCKYLAQNYPAPEHVYISGHSLGAGLASQFVSAVEQGGYGEQLRTDVKSWPWDNAILIAFAQPIPGDPVWAANFDKVSPTAVHYWVTGDDVVEATSGRILGMFIDKGEHVGAQKELTKIAECDDNPHEVFVIRASLIRDLPPNASAVSQQLGKENTWAYFESLSKMLAARPMSYIYPGAPPPEIVTGENLRKVLQNCSFGSEFDSWLEHVYAKMIADKSSYVFFKTSSTLDERRKLILDIVDWMRQPALSDNLKELDSLENEFKLIDGNLGLTNEEQWIFSAMILSRMQKSPLTVNELLSRPTIRTCLESSVQ